MVGTFQVFAAIFPSATVPTFFSTIFWPLAHPVDAVESRAAPGTFLQKATFVIFIKTRGVGIFSTFMVVAKQSWTARVSVAVSVPFPANCLRIADSAVLTQQSGTAEVILVATH